MMESVEKELQIHHRKHYPLLYITFYDIFGNRLNFQQQKQQQKTHLEEAHKSTHYLRFL